jgi:hypothetical protein
MVARPWRFKDALCERRFRRTLGQLSGAICARRSIAPQGKEERDMPSMFVTGKARRWVVAALGVVVVVAIVSTVAWTTLSRGHPAHASSSGGMCPPQADASPVCQVRGFSAWIFTSKVDTSTCPSGVYTYIGASTYETVTRQAPAPATNVSLVGVSVSAYNSCTYSYTQAYGETTTPNLQVRGLTDGATVQATIPTTIDWGTMPGPTLTVNITWTGVGTVATMTTSNDYRNGDFMFRARQTGDNRMAAVSGSISDGTTTYPVSGMGQISSVQAGSLIVVHV